MESLTFMENKEHSESAPDALIEEQERIVHDLCTRFPNGDSHNTIELDGDSFTTSDVFAAAETSAESKNDLPIAVPFTKKKKKKKKTDHNEPETLTTENEELSEIELERRQKKEKWQHEEKKKMMRMMNPELIAFDTVHDLSIDKDISEVLSSALQGCSLQNTASAMTPESLHQLLQQTLALSTKDLLLNLLSARNEIGAMNAHCAEVFQPKRIILGRRRSSSERIDTKRRRSSSSGSWYTHDATSSNSPEAADCYVHLLIVIYLFDKGDRERAKIAADTLIVKLDELDLRALDDISAKAFDYLALVYEDHGRLEELSSDFHRRLQTARWIDHKESQGTIICTLADIYAKCKNFPPTDEHAPKEVMISAYSDAYVIPPKEFDLDFRPPPAGIGIFFGPDHPMNTSWEAPCPLSTTEAEALAAYTALAIVMRWPLYSRQPITIYTDCMGVVNALRKDKNEFGTIFTLVCDRFRRLAKRFPKGVEIIIEHVFGHTGNVGNSKADELARKAIGLAINPIVKPPRTTISEPVQPALICGERVELGVMESEAGNDALKRVLNVVTWNFFEEHAAWADQVWSLDGLDDWEEEEEGEEEEGEEDIREDDRMEVCEDD